MSYPLLSQPLSKTLSSITRCILPALLLSASLSACGPMYQTVYDFEPPADSSGGYCIGRCESDRARCIDNVRYDYERCDQNAQMEQQSCRDRLSWEGKKEKWYDCGKTSCSNDTDPCEADYRGCYQSCGGRVTSRQECYMNCSQIPPAAPPAPAAPAATKKPSRR